MNNNRKIRCNTVLMSPFSSGSVTRFCRGSSSPDYSLTSKSWWASSSGTAVTAPWCGTELQRSWALWLAPSPCSLWWMCTSCSHQVTSVTPTVLRDGQWRNAGDTGGVWSWSHLGVDVVEEWMTVCVQVLDPDDCFPLEFSSSLRVCVRVFFPWTSEEKKKEKKKNTFALHVLSNGQQKQPLGKSVGVFFFLTHF